METKYQEEIRKLEMELEERQINNDNDMKLLQTRSEESLAQLKNFYENEKEKLEARLRDERDKANNKLSLYQEEFDVKMRNELIEKEDELDALRNSFAELEQRHNLQITQG
jgi:BMFP domain-containing protein YqiC